MNEAFVGVWFNIRLCYHKLMTSHMMRPQPFFFCSYFGGGGGGGWLYLSYSS